MSLRIAAVALGSWTLLSGCSSETEPATGGTDTAVSAGGDPVPAVADGTGGSSTGTDPADSDPEGVQSEESIEEYYRKLGVVQPVIDCYLDALQELGVTSLNQLEDDQALGAEAADRFDACVADSGTATTG